MRIDFVSDIACPWCAVGLASLENALARLPQGQSVDLHFQPFELNPQMGPEGANTVQYLSAKYGIGPDQIARNQATIRERGAAEGFAFGERPHVWNTFAAHRLLHWAGLQDKAAQRALKHALLRAYHGQGRNPGDTEVLVELAASVGLDAAQARAVLDEQAYAQDVREAEAAWQQRGIHSVPSVVINQCHLIQGGQPSEAFLQALLELSAQTQP
jgi:predicted DsbA family dithiol-disulfide isomerase